MESPPTGKSTRFPMTRVAWVVLLAGLALRELFSFWTGHPFDFEVWMRTGYVVAHGTNPYLAFWPPIPGVSFAYTNGTLPSAAYLPFWPGTLGVIYRGWEAAGGGNRFLLYFLIKQPGIAADVVTAYLVYQLVGRWSGSAPGAFRALALWSFFPYAIVVIAIWGQIDSILVVIVLAAFFLSDSVQRNLLWGFGVFVKWLTVIYLPLEAFRERGLRRLIPLVGLAVPALLTVAVFRLAGWSFAGGVQGTISGESMGGGGGMNFARFLSDPWVQSSLHLSGESLVVLSYLWIPVVVAGGWIAARWVTPGDHRSELRAILFVTTLFLLARWGLNEQYMLYAFAPWVVDIFAFHPGRRALLAVTAVVSFVFLFVNNTFGIWFFSPINTGYWVYASQLDASPGIGVFRTDLLFVLAALVILTLVQLSYVLYRDQPSPVPWLFPWKRTGATSPPDANAA